MGFSILLRVFLRLFFEHSMFLLENPFNRTYFGDETASLNLYQIVEFIMFLGVLIFYMDGQSWLT